MNIIRPSHTILSSINGVEILKHLEQCGRTCYKSEFQITPDSCYSFIRKIITLGHESVLEHISISVKIIGSRSMSHQLVRHRLASYSQESQRYVSYNKDRFGKEITVISPFEEGTKPYKIWEKSTKQAEKDYFKLLDSGAAPEDARSVLPNSCKTEIIVTMNLRSWRHFLKIRCDKHAQLEIRTIAQSILAEFQQLIPVIFDSL